MAGFKSVRVGLRAGIVGLAALIVGGEALGQSTWDGGGGNDSWATAANWQGDVAPVFPADLVFDGTARLTPSNAVTGAVVRSVAFGTSAGAFTVQGEPWTLGVDSTADVYKGSITHGDDSLQTINSLRTLARGQHLITTTSTGSLTLTGSINRTPPATARFAPAVGTNIKAPLTNNTAGIIGGWATIQNHTPARPEETLLWAKVDGSGNVVPYLDYTADTDIDQTETAFPATMTANTNIRWQGGAAAGTILNAPAGVTNISTFLFEQDLQQILNVGASNTLRFADGGGIFRSAPTGANVEGLRMTNGTVTAGNSASPATLQLWTNTTVDPTTTIGEQHNFTMHFQTTAITNNPEGGVVTVVKNGPGGVRISSAGNTFSGGLYVNRGVWRTEANAATALGSGPVFVASGAQLYLQNSGTYPNNISIAGIGVFEATNFQAGVIRGVGTGVVLSGTITMTAPARISQRGSQSTAANLGTATQGLTITGKITGNFPIELSAQNNQATGTGLADSMPTMNLTNSANDWTGDTTIGNGRVRVGGGGEVIPHGAGKGSLIMWGEGVAGRPSILTVDGRTETVNGLTTTGTAAEAMITNQAVADGTLRAGANDATSTYDGFIVDTPTFGKMHLTKIGAGSLTLNAVNAYTGSTRVEGGTLRITQPYLAATSNVFLTTGSTFNLDTPAATMTIDLLYIDGVLQPAGVYGGAGSGAAIIKPQLAGTGKLMVQNLTLPGDFNHDNKVLADDLGVWKTGFGVNSTGDADFDGDSDGNDFLIWQRQLGKTKPTVPAAGTAPEPGGLALACIAAAAFATRRRRS